MSNAEQLCPVETTLKLISNKWKPLIIKELMTGTKRSSELEKSLVGVSRKVLTENLRSLEDTGLLARNIYPEIPPKVEYSLTPLAESLIPILLEMSEWGTHYLAYNHKQS